MLDPNAYGPNLALASQGARLRTSRRADESREPSDSGGSRGYSFNWRDGSAQPMGCLFWTEGTAEAAPEWVQLEWGEEQTFDEVVLRLPVLILLPESRRTLRSLSLAYWDGEAAGWRAVEPTDGQSHPVIDWVAPTKADGSEIRAFGFEPVTTSKLRVLIEEGNRDGWSFLGAIEVYQRSEPTPPLALARVPQRDGMTFQPGDGCRLAVSVTDSAGLAVAGHPITFTGAAQVSTDRAGLAEAAVTAGPQVGVNRYAATGAGTPPETVEFELRTLSLGPALSAALEWLEGTAAELQSGSRVVAFDGTVMYTPDGVGSYDGFWVRDFVYMVEGAPKRIPVEHVRRGFEYLIARQRADGAMPNKVLRDGTPFYCPGPGCDSVFGPQPPPDNPSFMVKLAHAYWRLSGDLELFDRHKDELARGMEFLPRSPNTSLIHISPESPSSPYGFSDAIAKTGDQLFDSLLYWEASNRLAELLDEVGDTTSAARWSGQASEVERDVQTLYDPASGMFLAASVDCRQIDIWGSAYAAYLQAIPGEQREGVAAYLRANYGQLVRAGQVRHTAPGEHWQRTIVPNVEIYQNGPYWAVPSGWVATVIATIDRELAQQMLVDLVKDFQANGVNEAIHPEVGYVAIPNYVASACNPLPALTALAHHSR